MRVAMLTGSYPPEVCGIGDNTHVLVKALRERGVEVSVVTNSTWRLRDAQTLLRRLDALAPDIVHMQYPTVGYGAGLAPHLVSLRRPSVITLHEASQVHPLRRLSLLPLLARARAVVFTTRFERDYVLRFLPWLRPRSHVIPIGSSIPVGAGDDETPPAFDVCYFGLLRPDKGLEAVLHLAALAATVAPELRIGIVGQIEPRFVSYYEWLRSQPGARHVDWRLGASDAEVAAILARTPFGYLPFPDGASERRSTLQALLLNDVATLTTSGRFMTPDLAEAVRLAPTPESALEQLRVLRAAPEQRHALVTKARRYMQAFSWATIAERYITLYEEQCHGAALQEAEA